MGTTAVKRTCSGSPVRAKPVGERGVFIGPAGGCPGERHVATRGQADMRGLGYRMTVVRRERSACLRSSVTIAAVHVAVTTLAAHSLVAGHSTRCLSTPDGSPPAGGLDRRGCYLRLFWALLPSPSITARDQHQPA